MEHFRSKYDFSQIETNIFAFKAKNIKIDVGSVTRYWSKLDIGIVYDLHSFDKRIIQANENANLRSQFEILKQENDDILQQMELLKEDNAKLRQLSEELKVSCRAIVSNAVEREQQVSNNVNPVSVIHLEVSKRISKKDEEMITALKLTIKALNIKRNKWSVKVNRNELIKKITDSLHYRTFQKKEITNQELQLNLSRLLGTFHESLFDE